MPETYRTIPPVTTLYPDFNIIKHNVYLSISYIVG